MSVTAKLLSDYDIGRITRHEFLFRILQAAVEWSPADLAAELPNDFLQEVCELSSSVPVLPTRVISSVAVGPEFNSEAHFQEECQRLHDGKVRWHDYFSSTQPVVASDRRSV